MKILLIGPSYPHRGGISSFNQSLFRALARVHDVHSVGYSLLYPSLFFPGKTQFEEGSGRGSIRADRLVNTMNPLSWHAAARHIAKLEPCCIIIHYWMPFLAPALGSISRLVKRYHKTRIIGLLHNIRPHEAMIAGNMLNRYFLRSCDGFIVMSSTVRDQLDAAIGPGNHVRLIPHPVYEVYGPALPREDACRQLGLDPGQSHILFFGMIRRYKGLDLLLRAFAEKEVNRLKLKLIVAGEFYEDEERYMKMARELGIDGKIVFTRRYVPEGEVARYFSAADIVVLPYKSATQSGVTQVAFHFDKPVAATRVGGLGEVIDHGKTGYLCEKDPAELAACIADFFNNNRSDEFTMNIREEKKRFSWDAMVEGIGNLIPELRE